MELKVWVNSVQRVVCGVTPSTTCQDVVIALAQAMGRTGRFSLVERFRGTERPLAATDSPVEVLQKWGEYAPELKFVLRESSAKKKKKNVKESSNDAAVALRSGHRASPATAIKAAPKTTRVGSGSAIKKSLSFSGASFTPSGGLAACRTRQQAKKLSSSGNKFPADPANIDEEPTVEHDLPEAATPVDGRVPTATQAGEADASHMPTLPTSALRQQLQPAAAPRPSMLRQASITDAAPTRTAEVPRPPAPPQRRTSRSSSLCGGGDVSPDRPHQSSEHANGPVAATAPVQSCQREAEACSTDRHLPRQSSRRSDSDTRPRSKLAKAGEPTATSASEATTVSSPGARAVPAAVSSADGASQPASASQQSGTSSSSTITSSSGSSKASSSAAHSSLFRAVTEELKGQHRSSLLPRPTVLAGPSSSSAGSGSGISATNLSSSSAATSVEPSATSVATGTVADSTVLASRASRSVPQSPSSVMAAATATLPSASSHAAVQDISAGHTAADDRKPNAELLKHSAEERSRRSSVAAGTRLRPPGTSETAVLPPASQSVGATLGFTERRSSVRPAGAMSSQNSAGPELSEEKVQTPLAEMRNAKKESDASGKSSGVDQSEEYQRAINVVTLQERTLALQQSRLELLDKELVASQQKDRIRAEEASAVRRLLSELEATCRYRDRELEQYGDRSSSLLLDGNVGEGSPPSDCHSSPAELEALRLDGERIRAEAAAERGRLAECERSLAEHLQLVDQLSAHVAACREQLARLTSAKAETAGAAAPATGGFDRIDYRDSGHGDDADDDAEYRRLKGLCDEERAALDRLEAECAHASDDLRRAEAAVLTKRRAVETVELELRAAGSAARTPVAAAASAAGPEREASRAPVAATAGGGGGDAAVGGSDGGLVSSDADASSGLIVRAVAAKTAVGFLPSAPPSAGFRGGAAASGPVAKRPTTAAAKGAGRIDATYCH